MSLSSEAYQDLVEIGTWSNRPRLVMYAVSSAPGPILPWPAFGRRVSYLDTNCRSGLQSEQLHSAAIKGRPSGRSTCFRPEPPRLASQPAAGK
jgi:hypothetical protein